MKKVILIIACLIMLVLAYVLFFKEEEKENKKVKDNKSEQVIYKKSEDDKKNVVSNIDLNKLKEFTVSFYESDKIDDIKHIDNLLTDKMKSVVLRSYQGTHVKNSDDYTKVASNEKVYVSADDSNTILVTIETKTKYPKLKKMTYMENTIKYKIKDGKIDSMEEIGTREIFEKQ